MRHDVSLPCFPSLPTQELTVQQRCCSTCCPLLRKAAQVFFFAPCCMSEGTQYNSSNRSVVTFRRYSRPREIFGARDDRSITPKAMRQVSKRGNTPSLGSGLGLQEAFYIGGSKKNWPTMVYSVCLRGRLLNGGSRQCQPWCPIIFRTLCLVECPR